MRRTSSPPLLPNARRLIAFPRHVGLARLTAPAGHESWPVGAGTWEQGCLAGRSARPSVVLSPNKSDDRVGNGAGRGAAAKIRRMKRGIGGGALDRRH